MPVNIADSPFDLEAYMRRLGLPGPDESQAHAYDPYAASPTSPAGGTSDVVDWGTRQSSRENGPARPDRPGPPNQWDTFTSDPVEPPDPQPQTKQPGPCPAGYEWEDGGPDFPAGRCKIIGKTWEESQGQVAPGYPQAQPSAPAGNAGGGSSGGGAATKAPAYTFDLQALLNQLQPQYNALVAKIRSGTNPYDPSTIEALVGNRKVAAERQKLDQRNLLQAQRSATGRGTQGATQQDIRSIAAGADIASASDINQIRENAIKANYAAQIGRIDQEINALNSHANFVMGLAGSDTARNSAQLQYASQLNALQSQRQNLELQLQAALDQLKLQLVFGQ